MARPRIRPPALRPGGTIGICSPSFGALGAFPHRLEAGVAYLASLGFRTRLAANALGTRGHVSGTARERADDIHTLFADPEVTAVIAGIGGDHSSQLLPLLDWELIGAHPKIFMGMSDITVVNVAIHVATGLVTFNGPTLAFALAEYPRTLPYTEAHLLRVLTRAEPPGVAEPAEAWTDEFLDWTTRADRKRPRRLTRSRGWSWLRGGRASGPLIGGCLESLEHLRGTRWWPNLDGALLFIETSEERPSPERVESLLADYDAMGALGAIAGLLVANPYGYTDDERARLREVLLDATAGYRFPIVADMDFGHTQPVLTLPLGVRAEIDIPARRFAIVDPAVV